MGWLQLTEYEARLHASLEAGDEAAAAAAHEEQGYPSLQASLRAGPQRTSQLCAAMLQANGVLPDPQGRHLGEADDVDVDADGAHQAAAEGAAGAVDHRLLGERLASRRRLYDLMESALLDQGLALGEPLRDASGRPLQRE